MQANYLKEFEKFLESIKSYAELRKIKSVEQDLPKALNPLPLIYKFYWESKEFKSYEEFFAIYNINEEIIPYSIFLEGEK